MLETYSDKVQRRMNLKGFLDLLHVEEKFGPLTGVDCKILDTYWDRMVNRPAEKFNARSPLYAVDIRASPTHASNWVCDLFEFGHFLGSYILCISFL